MDRNARSQWQHTGKQKDTSREPQAGHWFAALQGVGGGTPRSGWGGSDRVSSSMF